MGDRQQFVVAAKVNGKYRMVASVHHQSIYGRTSLRQCLRILKIFSAPGNLPNIRRELADAASSLKPSISLDAYPFISTALIVGSSYHEEGHYTANVLPHKLDVSWDTFPTDEGIVVFDITDPSIPRYGYLWLGGAISRAQYVSRLPLMTVMTPAKYISGYYNVAELARNNVNCILAELRGFTLIDGAMLRDMWSNSEFKDMKKPEPVPDLQSLSLEDFGSAVVDGYLKAELDELPTPQELRKYRECITKRFVADPLLLHDEQGWKLFTHFVGGVNEVDLTPFVDIKVGQIMAIVKAASARKNLTIHLPSNDSINIEHLRSIVSTTAVCGLHLGRTTQVKLTQKLTGLFKDTSLTKLTSPLMFSRVVQIAFGPDENLQQAQVRVTEAFPNGIGSKFPLRQIVYLTSVTEPKAKRLKSGGLCWKQRTTKSHNVALFVKDALLSTHEMVKLAHAALARLATAQEWQLESQPVAKIVLGIAKMLSVDENHGIKPLPALMYTTATHAHYDSTVRVMPMMPIEFGGWTLLALHERPPSPTSKGTSTIRYAFIHQNPDSSAGQQHYKVLSAKTFLSSFAQGRELETLDSHWHEALARLRLSMTTAVERSPEAAAYSLPEVAALRRGGRAAMDAETCGDVEFGVAEYEEVVEALGAVDLLREKPINRSVEGGSAVGGREQD